MRGLNGGLIFLCSSSTQSISLKNGCTLIASSSPWDTTQPSRLLGLFVINYKKWRKNKRSVTQNTLPCRAVTSNGRHVETDSRTSRRGLFIPVYITARWLEMVKDDARDVTMHPVEAGPEMTRSCDQSASKTDRRVTWRCPRQTSCLSHQALQTGRGQPK